MTTESSTNGATTLSRMNSPGYVRHVTIFSRMFTARCLVCARVRIRLGVWLVSGYAHVLRLRSFVCVILPARPGSYSAQRLG